MLLGPVFTFEADSTTGISSLSTVRRMSHPAENGRVSEFHVTAPIDIAAVVESIRLTCPPQRKIIICVENLSSILQTESVCNYGICVVSWVLYVCLGLRNIRILLTELLSHSRS